MILIFNFLIATVISLFCIWLATLIFDSKLENRILRSGILAVLMSAISLISNQLGGVGLIIGFVINFILVMKILGLNFLNTIFFNIGLSLLISTAFFGLAMIFPNTPQSLPEKNTVINSTTSDDNIIYKSKSLDKVLATNTSAISLSNEDILALNFNNDQDNDGLTNVQEAGYKTDWIKADTDDDGFSDLNEINGLYNPIGSGKLVSDKCLKNPETDDCYLEMSIAQKDILLCQKISTKEGRFNCLKKINLITKNQKICEDLNKAPENDVINFYEDCLRALINIANPDSAKSNTNRDAQTISDIKQIQTALELYYNDNNKYPVSVVSGGKIGDIMNIVPSGIKGESADCLTNYEYKYSFVDSNNYSLTYCLDGLTSTAKNLGINSGINTATPNGINQ